MVQSPTVSLRLATSSAERPMLTSCLERLELASDGGLLDCIDN